MSAEAVALVRSFPVGRRTCTMTIQKPKIGAVVNMVVEWSPDNPRRFSPNEWRQYRKGRNAAVADLSKLTGLKAAVIEI